VVEKIISRALDNYQEAWEKIGDFRPKFENFETNPGFVQVVAPNESCGVIDFNITINEIPGEMSVCLPYLVVEPIVDKLSTSEWFTVGKKASTDETRAQMTEVVKDMQVPIKAMVGSSTLTMNDLMAMEKETVVRLDNKTDAPLEIQVGKSKKFLARPGLMGKRKVVKIVGTDQQESKERKEN
jgi:flagellar motor switch protein FliM